MERRPTSDEVMDMTGATRPLPTSGQQYPTVEQARAQDALNRQEEVLARRLLNDNMISIGPDETRSVTEIAYARGLLPLLSVIEVVEPAEGA